ncbi:MAG TPA: transglycosylase SLT domain-containing protein [Gammaproteobacteria bacterium]|jgi:soluble lytic murein transglycosylase-like protein|nr:transglycosylase SLT domain-containing protein [Gammaproteobacteria bacterium]
MRAAAALLCATALLAPGASWAKLAKPDPELVALVQQAAQDKSEYQDKYDEQVWLADMSQRLADVVPDTDERARLLKMIHAEASRAGLPPQLVLALIHVESRFDPYAVSRAGAVGLMQIMPFWLRLIGREHDSLVHPETNLRMGCTILKYYLGKTHGDIRAALQRYNGATVGIDYSDAVLKSLSRKWYWD